MISLIIEASTERGVVAIADDIHQKTFVRMLPFGWQQSQYLISSIQEVCLESQIDIKDLNCIALGVGPGSYTGIRMAASVAKSISYAMGIPIITFSSLFAFTPGEEGPFAAIFDAKIGGAYFITGISSNNEIVYSSKPEVRPIHELNNVLINTPLLITPNKAQIEKRIQEEIPTNKWRWREMSPDVPHLIKLVREKFDKKQWITDNNVELCYLRSGNYEKSY